MNWAWLLVGLLGWCTLSVLTATAWGALSWFYGTRDCNRPAILAARQELTNRRRDFVATNMRRL